MKFSIKNHPAASRVISQRVKKANNRQNANLGGWAFI